jgi:hypothetical protein
MKSSLFCNRASNCLGASLAVFIRFILYWVPALTELLIMTVNGAGTDVAQWTICLCALVQIFLAFAAGARLLYQLKIYKARCICICDEYQKDWDKFYTEQDFCCPTPLSPSSIWSGSNLTFILPAWILTNVISSWVDAKHLVWWIHLLCYLPFPAYALGLGIGYVWTATCEDEYEEVPSA